MHVFFSKYLRKREKTLIKITQNYFICFSLSTLIRISRCIYIKRAIIFLRMERFLRRLFYQYYFFKWLKFYKDTSLCHFSEKNHNRRVKLILWIYIYSIRYLFANFSIWKFYSSRCFIVYVNSLFDIFSLVKLKSQIYWLWNTISDV